MQKSSGMLKLHFVQKKSICLMLVYVLKMKIPLAELAVSTLALASESALKENPEKCGDRAPLRLAINWLGMTLTSNVCQDCFKQNRH